jgi:integrase
MPYQYVREPLTADESDRLSSACETTTERLVVWTLLDTGLRVGELCGLTTKDILWQQRQLRIKGKGGAHGKRTKVRVVPLSNRVRTLLEHHFALEDSGESRPIPELSSKVDGLCLVSAPMPPGPPHQPGGRSTHQSAAIRPAAIR